MWSELSMAITETKLYGEVLQICRRSGMLSAGLGAYYLGVAGPEVQMCGFGKAAQCVPLGSFGFKCSQCGALDVVRSHLGGLEKFLETGKRKPSSGTRCLSGAPFTWGH